MKRESGGNHDSSLKGSRKALLQKKAELLVALGINCKRLADTEREPRGVLITASHEELMRLRLNKVLCGQLRHVEFALDCLDR